MVERREVELGRRSSEHAQILSGLEAGEEVVRYPTVDIREGVEIQR
jgi:multidrug efflux pump subunit AcrA (membrane-fusion protein)